MTTGVSCAPAFVKLAAIAVFNTRSGDLSPERFSFRISLIELRRYFAPYHRAKAWVLTKTKRFSIKPASLSCQSD